MQPGGLYGNRDEVRGSSYRHVHIQLRCERMGLQFVDGKGDKDATRQRR